MLQSRFSKAGRLLATALLAAYVVLPAVEFAAFAQDPPSETVYGPQLPAGNAARTAPESFPQELVAAVNQALETSPLIAASEAAKDASEADLRRAKWQRFPNLSVDILSTTGGSDVADTDGLAANVALEQPIWSGGAISSQIDEARFNRDAAGNRVDETRQTLVLDVAQAYFDVVAADERAGALRQGLAEHAELEASIERRVRQQVSPAVDLALARSRIAQLEAQLSSAEEQREIAFLRLTQLVGARVFEPTSMAELPPLPFASEAEALAEALACNPTLQAQSNLIAAAKARLDTAEADLLPRLLVQLSQNEITGARAALVLRAQTGAGLTKLSTIDGAEADLARAVAELAQSDRQIRTLIRREFATYRSSQRSVDASALASAAATELLASYRRQYVAGRRTWLDVLNALGELVNARARERTDRVAASQSAVLILVLTCRWQPQG